MMRSISTQQLRRFATRAEPLQSSFAPVKFLFKTGLVGSSAYALAIAAALYNDDANDFVVENLPGSVQALKAVGEYRSNGAHLHFDETFKQIETLKEKIEASVGEKLAPKPTPLPAVDVTNEAVEPVVKTLNQFIASVNESTATPATVATLSASLEALAAKVTALTTGLEEEVARATLVKTQQLEAEYAAKANEATAQLLEELRVEKAALHAKHAAQVAAELQAAQATIAQAATNAVDVIRIEQVKQFAAIVKEKVEQERNGKLAQLESLSGQLHSLVDVVGGLESHLDVVADAAAIQAEVARVRALLSAPQPEGLGAALAALHKAAAHDELAALALANIPHASAVNGCLTVPQLITRWQLLVPELRSAALLPPNAGLLGHLSSMVFSKLLLSKSGHSEGDDIESVVARVENYLARGDLADAVEEAASLKGWGRKLANGWVEEGRQRLEVEFLLDVVEASARS